jgi:hypothetical protein
MHYGHFGTVTLYGDTKTPENVALSVSGEGGWNKGMMDIVMALASQGTLVIAIDIVHYLRSLDKSREGCI